MKKLLSLLLTVLMIVSTFIAVPVTVSAESIPAFLAPITGRVQEDGYEHAGVDIHAPKGTPVYAVADGEILYSEFGHTPEYPGHEHEDTRYSVKIKLKTPLEFKGKTYVNAFYTHLSQLVYDVSNSSPKIEVSAGALIGYSGVGNGAAHLHFSFETFDSDSSAGYEHMGTSDLVAVFGWGRNENIVAKSTNVSSGIYTQATSAGLTLKQLQTKFPHGKYWNHSVGASNNPDGYTSSPCTHHGNCSKGGTDYSGWCGCNSFKGTSIQCEGFARKLGYDAFGTDPNSWSKSTSTSAIDSLKPGDIVRYASGSYYHTIFVISVSGENITVAECNYNSKCNIGWGRTTTKTFLKGRFYTPSGCSREYGVRIAPKILGGGDNIVIPEDTCTCSTSYAGTYVCTTSSAGLNIRAGHSTSDTIIGSIPSGATVTVSKANGSWAHITYNGVSGCASMSYLAKIEPLIDGYPLPFKACPLATGETAAEALWSNGSVRGYIYGSDDCTIKKIYSSGMCLLNCKYNNIYQDIYAYINDFLCSTTKPTQKTVEAYATTYYRSTGSDERGWIDAGDKVYVIGSSGSRTQVIYPHTDGTYRCAWVATSALTHTHTPGAAATCIAPQVCTKCDVIIKNVTDHTPGTAATCTAAQVCKVCENILVSAKGHSWNEGYVSREPTCIQTGNLTKTCTSCGTSQNFNIEIVPNAHKWDSGTVTKAATCTSTGVKTYRCINMLGTVQCTTTKTETIPVTEHSWNEGYVSREPTCIQTGNLTKTCTSCGATKNFNIEIDSNAHKWDSGTVTTPATCTTTGVRTYKCTQTVGSVSCTATKTETIPVTEHPWSDTVYYEESHPHKGYRICSPCAENGVREILYTGTTQTRATCSDCHPVTSVTLNKTTATVTPGNTLTLTATVNPTDAANKNVTWMSSDTTVATVSNGVVTAKKAGTATITVTTADGSKTATCTVTVKAATVITAQAKIGTVSSSAGKTVEVPVRFTVNPGVASFYFEFEYDHTKLHLAGIKNGADFSRAINTSLDNPNYVEDGTIAVECASVKNFTGVGEILVITFEVLETTPNGIYNVNCISSTGANHSMENVVFNFTNGAVTVNNTINVESVTLNKTSVTLTEGDTLTLTATVAPSNATNKNVTWSSSDATVATVSNGVVTAKKVGTATITVTTADGGKKATCTVTVKAKTIAVTGVTLDQSTATRTVGNSVTLTATVSPSNATNKNVTWSSSDTTVATVSNGVVVAKKAGTATITVTTVDGGKTATCVVTVKENTVHVTGVTLDKSSATLTEGDTLTLTATVAPSNATNKNVTWSSSDATVATVSNGVVTAKKAGTATITVTTADGSKKATCTVTVKASYDPNALTFTVGTARAVTGKTVKIDIAISNNPGIAGFSFKVGYNNSVMTLIGYECPGWEANASSFDDDETNNPVGFSWNRTKNYTSNTTILTLTFEIKADAPAGDYALTLSTGDDIVANQNGDEVKYNLVDGKITVVDCTPGDANGDGAINSKDAVLLAQKLAGWAVEIDGSASDCNGDGAVNSKDAVLLAQYLAGWDVTLG